MIDVHALQDYTGYTDGGPLLDQSMIKLLPTMLSKVTLTSQLRPKITLTTLLPALYQSMIDVLTTLLDARFLTSLNRIDAAASASLAAKHLRASLGTECDC